MEAFLEDEAVTPADAAAAIRAATLDISDHARCCAARPSRTRACSRCSTRSSTTCRRRSTSRRSTGIEPRTGERSRAAPASTSPFAALAFKVMTDPYVGKLTYFRVYSGTLEAGSHVYNATSEQARSASAASCRCTPTTARSATRSARARSPPPSASSSPTTGDTLLRSAKPVLLESIEFPEPVIEVAIEPKTKADQDKLGDGAAAASPRRTRPSASSTDEETGQTHHRRHGRAAPRDHRRPPAARVQGRRQRRQAAGRLPRDHHATKVEKVEGRFVRQTGGRGQYGHVRHRHRARTSRVAATSS